MGGYESVFRRYHDGRIAQRESVPLTRGRSVVQSHVRPPLPTIRANLAFEPKTRLANAAFGLYGWHRMCRPSDPDRAFRQHVGNAHDQ